MTRRDVFQAIADPTRRAILDLLSKQPLTLNGVAQHFDISRPAVSKHVKILAECGLVVVHKRGRERYCQVRLDLLDEVSDWVEQHRLAWEQRLDRLEEYLRTAQLAGGSTNASADKNPSADVKSRKEKLDARYK